MSLAGNVDALATRVATEFVAVRDEFAAPAPRTVAYASTVTIDPTVEGDQVNITATGDVTSLDASTTGATDRQQLDLAVLGSGGARSVTFASAVHASTGLTRGPYAVPSGEALFALLRYSTLISAWTLVAATVTAS